MNTKPFDPRRPFTPQLARANGLDRAALSGPDFHRIMHGIYVSRAVPVTFELTARAVLDLMDDDAHLSHFSAARFWRLWVPHHPALHVCRVETHRHSRAGVVTHVCPCHGKVRQPGDVFKRKGIAVTSPIGCFFELATELSLVDLVILGDSLCQARTDPPGRVGGPRDVLLGLRGATRAWSRETGPGGSGLTDGDSASTPRGVRRAPRATGQPETA